MTMRLDALSANVTVIYYIVYYIQKQIISGLQIYKAMILRGSQRILDLDAIFSIPTIYLDFSNCDICYFSAGNDAHLSAQHILFSDLSGNYLNDVRFLSGVIFYNIILLDMSKNVITIFLNDDISLPFLQVIYLINNPLNIITITKNLASVKFFDLQGVRYKTSLINSLILIEHDTLQIVVTDFSMCCTFPTNVKCDCKCSDQRCYGIINGVIAKIIYHILVYFVKHTINCCNNQINTAISGKTKMEKLLQQN